MSCGYIICKGGTNHLENEKSQAGCSRLQWREDGRSVLVSAAALKRRLNAWEWTVEMYKRGLIGALEIVLLGDTSPHRSRLVIANTFRARRKRSNRREVRWLLVINSLADAGCVYHPECPRRRAKNPSKLRLRCSYAYWPNDGAQRQSSPGQPAVTSGGLLFSFFSGP